MDGLYRNLEGIAKIGSGFLLDPNPGPGRRPGGPVQAQGNNDLEKCDEISNPNEKRKCVNKNDWSEFFYCNLCFSSQYYHLPIVYIDSIIYIDL